MDPWEELERGEFMHIIRAWEFILAPDCPYSSIQPAHVSRSTADMTSVGVRGLLQTS